MTYIRSNNILHIPADISFRMFTISGSLPIWKVPTNEDPELRAASSSRALKVYNMILYLLK